MRFAHMAKKARKEMRGVTVRRSGSILRPNALEELACLAFCGLDFRLRVGVLVAASGRSCLPQQLL
ncbi:hypothetical protein SNK04_014281 [Fusarium graminearum]